jgi:hypothetical protein
MVITLVKGLSVWAWPNVFGSEAVRHEREITNAGK